MNRFDARPQPLDATITARRQFLTSLSWSSAGTPPGDSSEYWIRVHRRAMACRFEITLAASDGAFVPAAGRALDEIDRLEDELSVFRGASALSEINRCAAARPVRVSAGLFALLTQCRRLHQQTGGAFDITTTPLSRCWGFLRREGRVPESAAIEAARALVGLDALQLAEEGDERSVRLTRPGAELNLGAIGKGYALDRAGALLKSAGVRRALLSGGGSSLLALGGRGAGWRIDVVSPLLPDRAITGLWLENAAVGTSGAGEQFVISDGRRYGHVIDPRTGWPAAGVLSASVVASEAASADALSTAFLIGGIELAEQYCAQHANVLALITLDDDTPRTVRIGSHPGARIVES